MQYPAVSLVQPSLQVQHQAPAVSCSCCGTTCTCTTTTPKSSSNSRSALYSCGQPFTCIYRYFYRNFTAWHQSAKAEPAPPHATLYLHNHSSMFPAFSKISMVTVLRSHQPGLHWATSAAAATAASHAIGRRSSSRTSSYGGWVLQQGQHQLQIACLLLPSPPLPVLVKSQLLQLLAADQLRNTVCS